MFYKDYTKTLIAAGIACVFLSGCSTNLFKSFQNNSVEAEIAPISSVSCPNTSLIEDLSNRQITNKADFSKVSLKKVDALCTDSNHIQIDVAYMIAKSDPQSAADPYPFFIAAIDKEGGLIEKTISEIRTDQNGDFSQKLILSLPTGTEKIYVGLQIDRRELSYNRADIEKQPLK
jgi:hypothetical protein